MQKYGNNYTKPVSPIPEIHKPIKTSPLCNLNRGGLRDRLNHISERRTISLRNEIELLAQTDLCAGESGHPEDESKKSKVVKRPHSPINKELLYMDNVDNFIKTIGITPKLKFDEIVVNNDGAMQIIDMIFRRYKKIGRDE
jgi:hypothetical protein